MFYITALVELRVGRGHDPPSLRLCGAFNALPDFQRELRQLLQRNLLARIQKTKHVRHCSADFFNQVDASLVQQPPAQTQIASVGLKVVAVGVLKVVVVVVFEADLGGVVGRGERHNRGKVVAAAQEVELDAGEEGEEGEGVDEGEGTCYGWAELALLLFHTQRQVTTHS